MKHIADPSSLLLDGLAAEGCRIAGTWIEMSGSFGVGICFDTFLFFSFRSTKIPADYYWFLMRHDYQADYIFNSRIASYRFYPTARMAFRRRLHRSPL
jgi:hypothetical protein